MPARKHKLSRTSKRLSWAMAEEFQYEPASAQLRAWDALDARLLYLENQVRRLKALNINRILKRNS